MKEIQQQNYTEALKNISVKDGITSSYFRELNKIDVNQYASIVRKLIENGKKVKLNSYAKSLITKKSAGKFKKNGDFNFDTNKIPQFIIDITQSSKFRLGTKLSHEDRLPFEQKIASTISKGETIQFLLLGSAFKIDNGFKTGGKYSDIAEFHALLQIQSFLDEVNLIFPSVEFHYIWEGRMYADCAGVPSCEIEVNWKIIKEFCDILNDKRIHIHDMVDLAEKQGLNFEKVLNSISCKNAQEPNYIMDVIKTPHWLSFLQTHRPLLRNLSLEDNIIWYKNLTQKNKYDQSLKPIMLNFYKYSEITQYFRQYEVVTKSFQPNAIRLTARPRKGAIGFSVAGNGQALLPHHGVAVIKNQRTKIRHMQEIIQKHNEYRAIVSETNSQIIAFEKLS